MKKNEIIVITGLPRSGTSLMMQIMQTLGITLFTDNKRQPDKSNPKGYFEHELVKNIEKDSEWIANVKGKAVKIISPLLIHLPQNCNCKIIFMHRDYDEIIKSQEKMLSESASQKSKVEPNILKKIFDKDMKQAKKWISQNQNCECLDISHANLINNPESEIDKIVDFLQIKSDWKKAVTVIDRNLHRAKIN